MCIHVSIEICNRDRFCLLSSRIFAVWYGACHIGCHTDVSVADGRLLCVDLL